MGICPTVNSGAAAIVCSLLRKEGLAFVDQSNRMVNMAQEMYLPAVLCFVLHLSSGAVDYWAQKVSLASDDQRQNSPTPSFGVHWTKKVHSNSDSDRHALSLHYIPMIVLHQGKPSSHNPHPWNFKCVSNGCMANVVTGTRCLELAGHISVIPP